MRNKKYIVHIQLVDTEMEVPVFAEDIGVACYLKFDRQTGWLNYQGDCFDEDDLSPTEGEDTFGTDDSF